MVSSKILHSSLDPDWNNVIQFQDDFWKVKLLMIHLSQNTK